MAEQIDGNAADNFLEGSSDDDVIRGRAGDDVISGLGGDDVLEGGSGDDSIDGGSGDDEIGGGSGDDVIDGGAGDDVITAGAGDDQISSGSGDDVIRAGSGDDLVSGGGGDDDLGGGSGDDVLEGGAGSDVMAGGAGLDTFRMGDGSGEDMILDFTKGEDRLDLTAFTSYEMTQVGDDTIVTVDGGKITLRGVTPEGLADSIDVACLLRGSLIATRDGEVAVETLRVGDEVLTLDGDSRPVKWIGCRSYAAPFMQVNPKLAPVCIAAGALGGHRPHRDLYVSQEHAMYLDGGLVPSRLLVDGETIRLAFEVRCVEYFHVEFDTPDVIFANGAPTETYANHGNRRMFGNWNDYVSLYGGEDEAARRPDGEYERRFNLIFEGPRLEAIKARLTPAVAKAA